MYLLQKYRGANLRSTTLFQISIVSSIFVDELRIITKFLI